eukprot:891282-Pyramimonas_sp.AAC.1
MLSSGFLQLNWARADDVTSSVAASPVRENDHQSIGGGRHPLAGARHPILDLDSRAPFSGPFGGLSIGELDSSSPFCEPSGGHWDGELDASSPLRGPPGGRGRQP